MSREPSQATTHLIGKAFGGVLVLAFLVWAIQQDRHERALVAQGLCTKITEALYSPPPRASTRCHGSGSSSSCSTSYYQSDPYMRSLWRCRDPEQSGRQVEFWRRTTEEDGR